MENRVFPQQGQLAGLAHLHVFLCPLQWMRARWTSDPCYAFFGVDGTECSFLIYLSEVEWFCPPLPWRNRTVAVPSRPPKPRAQVRWAQPGFRGFWGEALALRLLEINIQCQQGCGASRGFSQNHRMVGVRRDLHGQGHLAVEQVLPSPAQPGIECFKGWSIHQLCASVLSSSL